MDTGTPKENLSLAKEFQQHLKKKHRKYGVIDQGKYKKRFMERKYTDRQYHVQDNAAVEQQYVKIYCNTSHSHNYFFMVHIPNLMAQRG